jgi:ferritin
MFHHSWEEELEHGDKLRAYGVKRGASISVKALDVSYKSQLRIQF